MNLVREMFDLASKAREKALHEENVRAQRMAEKLEAEIEIHYLEILKLIKTTAEEGKLSYEFSLTTSDITMHLNYHIPLINKLQRKLAKEGFRAIIDADKTSIPNTTYKTSLQVSWDLHAVYGY